ncbi:MAG: SoxR reducing system RseC family protein [Mariprofundaceae bacterium]
MRQTAYVIQTQGEQATVVSERASSCGGCAGKASCNTLGSWKEGSGRGRILELSVQNTMNAQLDDEVTIEVADGLLLKTAFRLYAVPMLLFISIGITFWFYANWLASPSADVWASISGIGSVLAYYAWIWKQGEAEGFAAKIVAVKARSRPD